MFHEPRQQIGTTPAGKAGEVHLAIALTDLSVANGLFVLFKAQALQDHSTDQGEEQLILKAGEGVIWEGDSIGTPGNGEGGIFLVIQYR